MENNETMEIFMDLILTEDTTFKESIEVKGNIRGYFDLKVCGNIDCRNIDCGNIVCRNIVCRNIVCRNIDCGNIVCRNIDCLNIVYCEKLKIKEKIRCKVLIKNRSKLKVKEWNNEENAK